MDAKALAEEDSPLYLAPLLEQLLNVKLETKPKKKDIYVQHLKKLIYLCVSTYFQYIKNNSETEHVFSSLSVLLQYFVQMQRISHSGH